MEVGSYYEGARTYPKLAMRAIRDVYGQAWFVNCSPVGAHLLCGTLERDDGVDCVALATRRAYEMYAREREGRYEV